jgi:peroxiredoxin
MPARVLIIGVSYIKSIHSDEDNLSSVESHHCQTVLLFFYPNHTSPRCNPPIGSLLTCIT